MRRKTPPSILNPNLSEWCADIFESFYRPDESRNWQIGGNGSGLSIVAALACANGWKVELHAHDAGVMVQVWFPRLEIN